MESAKETSSDFQTQLEDHSHLYHTLESGADGKPGGILITSVAQEVLPGIWIGGYTALESQKFLKKNDITHILSMGHFEYSYPSAEYDNKIIRISDNPGANIIQFFPETYEYINNAVSNERHILVHCLAGVSRSPTVVTAYLMKKRRLRPKEALAIIAQSRPFINPNKGFMDQLKLYREMDYTFDPKHPAYLAYIAKHPLNGIHTGHDEYKDST
ncbi:protein-tyrosine phosphatase-like protein [Phycomyces blakesleeanus]|uniref:protein-tyrosine-phosphatase n=2 Tax=Phycomyces blakesleeanus TaxID=4837 RepID=A0ABR3BDX2_PHYBL